MRSINPPGLPGGGSHRATGGLSGSRSLELHGRGSHRTARLQTGPFPASQDHPAQYVQRDEPNLLPALAPLTTSQLTGGHHRGQTLRPHLCRQEQIYATMTCRPALFDPLHHHRILPRPRPGSLSLFARCAAPSANHGKPADQRHHTCSRGKDLEAETASRIAIVNPIQQALGVTLTQLQLFASCVESNSLKPRQNWNEIKRGPISGQLKG